MEAMLWIKEVELFDSVVFVFLYEEFKCEVLDAKIASALNRIIHNTQLKRKISLEE